jgi:hypothetical protein
MTVTITPAPSPNGTNHERLYLVRAPSRSPRMARDGKLGDALRKKYRSPREALRALGLDESLLDASRLAFDRKARDGVLSPDAPNQSALTMLETMLAEHLQGSELEKAQRLLEAIQHEAGIDHGAEEEDGMVDDDREEMPDEEKRLFRCWQMKGLADHCIGEKGWTTNDVREMFAHPDFLLKSGIETGGAGGGALAQDIDWTMEQLEGMGGTATSGYEPKADRRMAKDKRRKLALDRKRQREYFGMDRLEPRRGDFCNYGDQPTLAYDESADDGDSDSEFFKMFPEARRLSTPG